MLSYDGFENILMAVIRSTANENEHLTDEERFDNAMYAIFGHYYEKWHDDAPSEFTIGEVLSIHNLRAEGLTWAEAVRRVKGFGERPENKVERAEFDAELETLAGRVKKALLRKKEFYKSFSAVDSDWDLEPNKYEGPDVMHERQEKRKSIFKALRDAGWPV
jgi:hypothetical protein